MKKKLVLLIVLAFMLIGCSNQSPYDNDKRQFIEIYSSSNELVGILEDSKSIKELIQKLDIKSWIYCDDLKNNAKLKYTYITYEVVDDPVFLGNNAPFVNRSIMELYEAGGEYYIVECIDGNKDIIKVSINAANYLNVPELLNIDSEKTAEEILAKWKTEINGLCVKEETIDEEDDNSVEEDDSSEEDEKLSESDVKKVSKEQRIDIMDNEKNVVLYSTTKISEITDILNQLSMDEQNEVSEIPDTGSVENYIVRYALERKNLKQELQEMCQEILYKDKDNYYIKKIVPNNGKQLNDYIICYKISEETAEYIHSLYIN